MGPEVDDEDADTKPLSHVPKVLKSPTYLDCWFLTGCTASGKSIVGLELAERLGAEIVSMDSMTVYRGMNIGTAKPTADDRARLPHHLIDVRDPDQEFSLANYLDEVQRCVADIRRRSKVPLFVGGTPLYLKALLRGVYTGPPADWEFRRSIKKELMQVGVEALHDRLAHLDPLSASKLPKNDVRRIIRALEVHRVTGQPISHWQTHFEEGHSPDECRVFVLNWPRAESRRRIGQRVERMFQAGFLAEVESLRQRFGQLGRTASQAVGYREVWQYLDHPSEIEHVKEQIKTRTCQFAKRQTTWFRGLTECHWVACDDGQSPGDLAATILKMAI